MTSLRTYALDQFVADMAELINSQPDQAKLFDRGSVYLERLIQNPNAIPEQFQRPVGTGKRPNHGSYALYRGDGLFVSAVVWGPGDYIGPHDHQTWGMIGVMGNAIQETRYRRVDDRNRDGYARLETDRSTLVKPVHRMDNSSDRSTVEIHVYGHDLVGLPRFRYDIESGKVTPFASEKFDNC
jgi:predicted metal-dependent enzyme (double-stranded beta helix superfamily)